MIDGFIDSGVARLYYRVVGHGPPLIVLHGGPTFSHRYLLPEIDILASSSTLILYDQRGRGRSAERLQASDVDIESEIEDLNRIRDHLGLERVALAGHSWGGLLAAEYALRHPERVSPLIFMNSAPLSHESFMRFRSEMVESRSPETQKELLRIAATTEYQQGDVEAEREFNRLYFRATIRSEVLLEAIVARMGSGLTPESLMLAREITDRLNRQTWMSPDYSLLPQLNQVSAPTLVLHSEYDLIPVSVAHEIAAASTNARLVVLEGCGHFAFAERPDQVAEAVNEFLVL